jgi:geranylgeranyl pyrophosphate synthase
MSVAVDRVAEAVGAYIPVLLGRVEDRLAEVAAGAGAELAPHTTATIAAGGKRLRPLLVLLAAGSEPADPAPLVRAAVAVELIHSATLVHDDVLDAAELRRGVPTVVATGGRALAIAAGDFLFARAFAEVAAHGDPTPVRVLSAASSDLARGELLQRADAWDVTISRERYLERCGLKTASLFAAACELGAREGGGAALAAFGRRIGLAFQLLDDVLDVSGPAERTGKHRGTDLLDGTVTLPFILAAAQDADLAELDLRSVRTREDAEEVCERIEATGALHDARRQALALVAEAKAGLPHELPGSQRAALLLVADGVVDRYA